MEIVGTGSGILYIKFQIGSARILNFSFQRYDSTTGIYTDEDISTKTFEFLVKRYKGDRLKRFSLTNGNGITVPIYSTNEIRVSVSAINSALEEGEYYYELRRTDLNVAKVSGNCYFSFDAPQ